MSTIKNKAHFIDVPNTEEGNEFIRLLKKYHNKMYSIKVRGRGSRTKPAEEAGRGPRGYDQDLPLAKSTSYAVYMNAKDIEQAQGYQTGYFKGQRTPTVPIVSLGDLLDIKKSVTLSMKTVNDALFTAIN